MKLYLSSYKLGDRTDVLRDWIKQSGGNKIALIPNAGDAFDSPSDIKAAKLQGNIDLLNSVGFDASVLDLRDYFGKEDKLRIAADKYRAFWTNGGNLFVLRQAMKLNGFDKFLKGLKDKDNYLYGGYSAGICVLAKNMKGLELADDPKAEPYGIPSSFDGVGLLDFTPIPHYKSDHPESAAIENTVKYMQDNKLPYKTLRDGEVIII